jgi:hypothetical protein
MFVSTKAKTPRNSRKCVTPPVSARAAFRFEGRRLSQNQTLGRIIRKSPIRRLHISTLSWHRNSLVATGRQIRPCPVINRPCHTTSYMRELVGTKTIPHEISATQCLNAPVKRIGPAAACHREKRGDSAIPMFLPLNQGLPAIGRTRWPTGRPSFNFVSGRRYRVMMAPLTLRQKG